MEIVITASAGFIGFHLARRLPVAGHRIVGVDAMVPCFDVRLNEARHALLAEAAGFDPAARRPRRVRPLPPRCWRRGRPTWSCISLPRPASATRCSTRNATSTATCWRPTGTC